MTEGVQSVAGVDFFVSHAGRNRAWGEWVAWHLVEAGYTVELASWDWPVGENFVTKMRGALDAADRVVALFSPAYFEDRRYTAEEWTSALVRDDEGGHRLVPVQVEPCVVPKLLLPLLRVELFDVDEAEAVRQLLAAVRGPACSDGKQPVFPGHGRAAALTSRGKTGPRLPGMLPAVWNVGRVTRGSWAGKPPWCSCGIGCDPGGRRWCRPCTGWVGWARPRWRSSTRTATRGPMTWCGGSAPRRPA